MTRDKFSNRRTSHVLQFKRGQSRVEYCVGFSFIDQDRVGEIFISTSEPGSEGEENARDGAILASLALQQGSTIDELCASLTKDEKGHPATVIGLALEHVREAVSQMSEVLPEAVHD